MFQRWFGDTTEQKTQRPSADKLYATYKTDLADFTRELASIYASDWNSHTSRSELVKWLAQHERALTEAASVSLSGKMTSKELRTTWLQELSEVLERRLANREAERQYLIELGVGEVAKLAPRALESRYDRQQVYRQAGLDQETAYIAIDDQLYRLGYEYPRVAEGLKLARALPWARRVSELAALSESVEFRSELVSIAKNPMAKKVLQDLAHGIIDDGLDRVLDGALIDGVSATQEVRRLELSLDKDRALQASIEARAAQEKKLERLAWAKAFLEECRRPQNRTGEEWGDGEGVTEPRRLLSGLMPRDREFLRRARTVRDLQSLMESMETLIQPPEKASKEARASQAFFIQDAEQISVYRYAVARLKSMLELEAFRVRSSHFQDENDILQAASAHRSLDVLREDILPKAIRELTAQLQGSTEEEALAAIDRNRKRIAQLRARLAMKTEGIQLLGVSQAGLRKNLEALEKAFFMPKSWAKHSLQRIDEATRAYKAQMSVINDAA